MDSTPSLVALCRKSLGFCWIVSHAESLPRESNFRGKTKQLANREGKLEIGERGMVAERDDAPRGIVTDELVGREIISISVKLLKVII